MRRRSPPPIYMPLTWKNAITAASADIKRIPIEIRRAATSAGSPMKIPARIFTLNSLTCSLSEIPPADIPECFRRPEETAASPSDGSGCSDRDMPPMAWENAEFSLRVADAANCTKCNLLGDEIIGQLNEIESWVIEWRMGPCLGHWVGTVLDKRKNAMPRYRAAVSVP